MIMQEKNCKRYIDFELKKNDLKILFYFHRNNIRKRISSEKL